MRKRQVSASDFKTPEEFVAAVKAHWKSLGFPDFPDGMTEEDMLKYGAVDVTNQAESLIIGTGKKSKKKSPS